MVSRNIEESGLWVPKLLGVDSGGVMGYRGHILVSHVDLESGRLRLPVREIPHKNKSFT